MHGTPRPLRSALAGEIEVRRHMSLRRSQAKFLHGGDNSTFIQTVGIERKASASGKKRPEFPFRTSFSRSGDF
jgi:hypothetical protein